MSIKKALFQRAFTSWANLFFRLRFCRCDRFGRRLGFRCAGSRRCGTVMSRGLRPVALGVFLHVNLLFIVTGLCHGKKFCYPKFSSRVHAVCIVTYITNHFPVRQKPDGQKTRIGYKFYRIFATGSLTVLSEKSPCPSRVKCGSCNCRIFC